MTSIMSGFRRSRKDRFGSIAQLWSWAGRFRSISINGHSSVEDPFGNGGRADARAGEERSDRRATATFWAHGRRQIVFFGNSVRAIAIYGLIDLEFSPSLLRFSVDRFAILY
jgi:hypothetical protein